MSNNNKCHLLKGSLIPNKPIHVKIDVPSLGISDMRKVASVLPRGISVNLVTNMDISHACVLNRKYLSSPDHLKHTDYKLEKCMGKKTPYVASQKN